MRVKYLIYIFLTYKDTKNQLLFIKYINFKISLDLNWNNIYNYK